MIQTQTLTSPLGPIQVTACAGALVAVQLVDAPGAFSLDDLGAQPPRDPAQPDAVATQRVLARAVHQLAEYFAGRRNAFDLPLAPRGTAFQHLVWGQLSTIPHGETRSYGDIACGIGRPTASRAVGAANSQNPIAIIVPCHRVIGANGTLTGYAGGLAAKRWLLEHEQHPRRISTTDELPY